MKTAGKVEPFGPKSAHAAGNEQCTVAGFFAAQRDRLADLWQAIAERIRTCGLSHETLHTVETGSLNELKQSLRQFAHGLRQRVRMEEQFFFLLEETTWLPKDTGFTASPRLEHRRIEEFLDRTERALDACTCASTVQAIEAQVADLAVLLRRHDEEERSLYFRADQTLPAQEVRALLRRIQSAHAIGIAPPGGLPATPLGSRR